MTMTANAATIAPDALDPMLQDIGLLVGLLQKSSGGFTLNAGWFDNPLSATQQGVRANAPQLTDLLERLLGSVGGNALVPSSDPALLGTWIPIPNPAKANAPTNLYVVSYQLGAATVFGLGAKVSWSTTLSGGSGAITGPSGVMVEAWALFPLVSIDPATGVSAALGASATPINLGIAIEGQDNGAAAPIISVGTSPNSFAFDGVKLSANIDLTTPAVDVSLVVLALQLPGETTASDRTLADLETLTAAEIMQVASTLFASALSEVSATAGTIAGYFLPALGLSEYVPGLSTTLPLLPWYDIAAAAAGGKGNATAPVIGWFTSISSDPALTRAWLTCISGLAGVSPLSAASVTGSGTREDPFVTPLIAAGGALPGALSFSFATEVDGSGLRHIYPGLVFQANPYQFGSSSTVLAFGSTLELAEFKLFGTQPPAYTGPSSLRLTTLLSLQNQDATQPLFSGTLGPGSYSFGSFVAGFSVDAAGSIAPVCQLVSVSTPAGDYATIDLTSPGQLGSAAESNLGVLIQDGLQALFGITGTGSVSFPGNLAALLGVIPPPCVASWPASAPQPPFFGTQIATSILDPVGALGSYYQALVASSVQANGQPVFVSILSTIASLFQASGVTTPVTVTGDGTADSPWLATLTARNSPLPATLTASASAVGNATRLLLGLQLGPTLTLPGGFTFEPLATIHFLSLDLAVGSVAANWLPDIGLALTLPQGYQTPSIANSNFAVTSASLSAAWSRFSGWNWSLLAVAPSFTINGTKLAFSGNLDWSDQQSLQNLVRQTGQAFAPVLVGSVGVALASTGTRAGTTLAGVLGLLPDPTTAANFPSSLTAAWKAASLDPLTLTSLDNPFPDLLTKLTNDFSSNANAQAVLGLLGWCLNPGRSTPPSVAGTGAADDPWRVGIAGTAFEAVTWFDGANSLLGLGLGRTDRFAPLASLAIEVQTTLAGTQFSLATGAFAPSAGWPSLTFATTFGNPSGNLFQLGTPNTASCCSLGELVLGFTVTLSSGKLGFAPIVTLVNARLPGETTPSTYTFDQLGTLASNIEQSVVATLNLAVQTVVTALLDSGVSPATKQTFQTCYGLLVQLGLALEVKQPATTGYGINPGGWQALLADPLAYIEGQLLSLLTDPAARTTFFQFISSTLGVTLPTIPAPVLETLATLGILGDAAHGYPLRPAALLQFAQNPFAALRAQFDVLFPAPDYAPAAQVQALVSTLDQSLVTSSFGKYFTFEASNGATIELAVSPATPIVIGNVVAVSGGVSFDLVRKTIGADLSLFNSFVGLALAPSFAYPIGGTPTFELQLVWGDGTVPAPAPLELVPFDGTQFLDQLANVAPGYVLSTVVTQVVDGQLLPNYPLAQAVFEGLGLSAINPNTQKWQTRSLLGLLKDPLGWLLSPGILGDSSGRFSLSSLQTVLNRIPAVQVTVGSSQLGVKSYTADSQTGIQIYGFPYGFGAVITSDGSTTATIVLQTRNLALTSSARIANLEAGITLGTNFQPGFIGDLNVSGTVSNYTLFVDAGYDKEFSLTVGQQNAGPTNLSLQLVPFAGWGTVVEQAARMAASAVLNDLVPQLLTALQKQGPAPLTDFITRLQTAGSDLQIGTLVSNLTAIPLDQLTAAEIEQVVVTWLVDRVNTTAAATATASAIVTLLNGIVPGSITNTSGLVVYRPASSVPLTINLGVTDPGNGTQQLGIWAGVGLPASSLFVPTIKLAGVGFPVARLASGPAPMFQFSVQLFMPVEGGTVGPWLELAYDPASSRFVGTFDPLYTSSPAANSSLAGQLFPKFFLGDASAVEAWLLGVVKNVLPRYVSAVVLNTSAVKTWLGNPVVPGVAASPTAAAVLTGAQLIQNVGTASAPLYVLTPFDQLAALTAGEVIGGLLFTLMQTELQVLSWGSGSSQGGVWIGPESATAGAPLGVRVAAPGLGLSSIPNLVIQLGAADSSWIANASTGSPTVPQPGLSFYVPVTPQGKGYTIDFSNAALNLANVGVDFVGKNGAPLVDLSRFQLGGVSPRALFTVDFNGGSPTVTFGGAITLDAVALSLAPNQASSTDNPVAQNLLGAGSDSSGGGGSGGDKADNPAANPSFSIQGAYVDKLYVQLLDANGQPASQLWFPVQRAFGPLYANEIGVGWEGGNHPLLDLLFSGSVTLAGFKLSLVGLEIGIPVSSGITDFSQYKLSLAGFDLTFNNGPVKISGGFLEDTTTSDVEYTGLAVISASKFSLFAVGSYAAVPTNPPAPTPTATSLFIFGALDAPLGGVPAFFITGIAAGFSYNRGLKLPDIDGVQDYPLVKGVVDGSFQSSSSGDVKSALATIAASVYPEIGEYWLAAGLKFTSFRMINGCALLFVQFGRSFQISLLGVASLPMPKTNKPSDALAYVELALKAVINPDLGVVSIQAQLTPNSFVISQACKLTGGFAFFLWFKDQTSTTGPIHAGDFVVTLGGYMSAFQKPAHYPDVPRLGFYWPLDFGFCSVSVSGGAYFALTASAVMAGGYLNASFEAGPLKAWFNSNADFLASWAPFYYVVDIGVDVGVSFGTTIGGVSVTLSASLGANLHLQGPPTWGFVEVDWFVISFTIPFGDGTPAPTASLDWDAFSAQFLPAPTTDGSTEGSASNSGSGSDGRTPQLEATASAAPAPASGGTQQVLKLQAQTGLVSSDADSWTFNAQPFTIRVDTAIPINSATITNQGAPAPFTGPTVGIQPMNLSSVDTPLTVTIGNAQGPITLNPALRFGTATDAAPQSTWGSTPFDRSRTPDGSDMLVLGTLKSILIIGDQCYSNSSVGPFAVANLKYQYNPAVVLPFASQLPFNSNPTYGPSAAIPGQAHALAVMMQSIMDPAVVGRRNLVFATLRGLNVDAPADPDLHVMAASADQVVQAPPVLAHLGVFVAAAPQGGQEVASETFASKSLAASPRRRPAPPLQFKGMLRRHRLANGAIAARWSELARTAPRVLAVARAISTVVHSGSIAQWSGPVGRVVPDGDQPIRLSCFDANHELLADLHDVRSAVTLPSGTLSLSAHGPVARDERDMVGWSLGDQVLKATMRCYVGDGFTLRPQAFVDQRRHRRPLGIGLVDIADVQAHNLLTGNMPGGLETVFAGTMRSVAVRVPKGTPAGRIAVSLAFVDRPAAPRDRPRLSPVASRDTDTETIHFYQPPAESNGAHLCVWTKPLAPAATILGVTASTLLVDTLSKRASLLAPPAVGAEPAAVRLTLSSS